MILIVFSAAIGPTFYLIFDLKSVKRSLWAFAIPLILLLIGLYPLYKLVKEEWNNQRGIHRKTSEIKSEWASPPKLDRRYLQGFNA